MKQIFIFEFVGVWYATKGRGRGLKGSRGGDRKSLDGRKKFRMSREALEWGGALADGHQHLVAVGLEGRGRRV